MITEEEKAYEQIKKEWDRLQEVSPNNVPDNDDDGEGGTSVAWFIFIVFLVLKLLGKVDWSWWFVFAPLWSWYISIFIYYTIFYWSKYNHEDRR